MPFSFACGQRAVCSIHLTQCESDGATVAQGRNQRKQRQSMRFTIATGLRFRPDGLSQTVERVLGGKPWSFLGAHQIAVLSSVIGTLKSMSTSLPDWKNQSRSSPSVSVSLAVSFLTVVLFNLLEALAPPPLDKLLTRVA